MAKNVKAYQAPTHDQITARAQRIYEQEGRPEGRAMSHWLEAESQLVAEHKAQAGAAQPAQPRPKPAAPSTPAGSSSSSGWQTQPRQTPLNRN